VLACIPLLLKEKNMSEKNLKKYVDQINEDLEQNGALYKAELKLYQSMDTDQKKKFTLIFRITRLIHHEKIASLINDPNIRWDLAIDEEELTG
jgi:uncharacterized protein YajQ (UPF0234 family)